MAEANCPVEERALDDWVSGNFLSVLRAPMPENLQKAAFCPCAQNPLVGISGNRLLVIARYSGVISLSSSSAFRASLAGLLHEKTRIIVLDLSGVTRISPTIAGALIDFKAAVFGMGKKLYLYRTPLDIERLLDDLKIKGFFHMLADEKELVMALPMV